MKITIVILVILFSFFLSFFLEVKLVSATNHCSSLANTQGTHGPVSRYTGRTCTNPAQYNSVTSCIGTTGNRYIVTYCTADGCEEEYPEQGPSAPTLCQRPDTVQSDIEKVFGKIIPPVAIQNFGFGALGISTFLSNLIALIYVVAIVVLIFMILWGAFDWITSEGEKEKIEAARGKIIHAIIGILLFAAAFAIIQVLGQFTGFTFFVGQK